MSKNYSGDFMIGNGLRTVSGSESPSSALFVVGEQVPAHSRAASVVIELTPSEVTQVTEPTSTDISTQKIA